MQENIVRHIGNGFDPEEELEARQVEETDDIAKTPGKRSEPVYDGFDDDGLDTRSLEDEEDNMTMDEIIVNAALHTRM